jgi:hypothetical protein
MEPASDISLKDIVPNPSVERHHYHLLSQEQLDKLSDAEALFERGERLRLGRNMLIDQTSGWDHIIHSARLGHPVAQALCCFQGKDIDFDDKRAGELLHQAAARGHPAG